MSEDLVKSRLPHLGRFLGRRLAYRWIIQSYIRHKWHNDLGLSIRGHACER